MSEWAPLLELTDVARLREALRAAGFTSEGLADALGAKAVRALERGDTGPLLPAITDESSLGTLIRLFFLAKAVPLAEVTAALGLEPVEALVDAGLLDRGLLNDTVPAVQSLVWLYPYRTGWLLADVGRKADDLVIGLSRYPDLLASARVGTPVDSALDLCAGSGVQSMHLSGQARSVTATDLSPRALRFAATSAALSELDWELLQGSLFSPVAGRRFDLVVANPPFIVKPGSVDYLYRDSGLPLDTLGATLAAEAPGVLTDGGTMQYLASFVHLRQGDWRDRVASWAAGTGLDAWIIQLSTSDPLNYVHTWSHGASLKDRAAWLAWLEEQDVEAIGLGLVSLRKSGRHDPVVRVDEMPGLEPRGAHVETWFDRQNWLRDNDLLRARYRAADGVVLSQTATLTEPDGWRVDEYLITSLTGTGRGVEVNQLVVDLVEGCDGTLSARELVAKLAATYGLEPAELTKAAAAAIPLLVEREVLVPVTLG